MCNLNKRIDYQWVSDNKPLCLQFRVHRRQLPTTAELNDLHIRYDVCGKYEAVWSLRFEAKHWTGKDRQKQPRSLHFSCQILGRRGLHNLIGLHLGRFRNRYTTVVLDLHTTLLGCHKWRCQDLVLTSSRKNWDLNIDPY